jgi:hypothetical protein
MKTDGIVFGNLIPFDDHTHLEWTCPDCGSRGLTGHSPYRITCDKTGREFLVVGVPADIAENTEYSLLGRAALFAQSYVRSSPRDACWSGDRIFGSRRRQTK